MKSSRHKKVAISAATSITAATTIASAFLFIVVGSQGAEAHFLGQAKNIDGYQVIFQPNPRFPTPGQNTTLNFSILQNSSNLNNVYVAMVMKERESGKIVGQEPYKLYEFSDISIPYEFHDRADYVVTLLARIYDSKYMAQPLTADFDISTGQTRTISSNEVSLTVAPVLMGLAGIVIFIFKRRK